MRSKRFDSDAIQRLYESDDYPLQRPAPHEVGELDEWMPERINRMTELDDTF
jgi:hypothetical protein